MAASSTQSLQRLDPAVRERVVAAVERFAQTGHGDVNRLTDVRPPEYRLRVGDWRVRFARDDAADVLAVLHVFPRDKAH